MNTWITPLDERALLAEHRRRLAELMHEASVDAAARDDSSTRTGLRRRVRMHRPSRRPRAAAAEAFAASSC